MSRTTHTALSLDEFLAQSPADTIRTPAYPQVKWTTPKATLQAATRAHLESLEGQRIRVHIADRKMAVPGRLAIDDGTPVLCTNWGLELDLSGEDITRIEVRNVDTGRFVLAA